MPQAEFQELVAELPEEKRRRLVAVLQAKSEIFQGLFPHPKHAVKYEEICPGFLERSLIMAENAQEANIENSRFSLENERRALENKNAEISARKQHDRLDSRDTARGQYLGFAALLILAAAALAAIYSGHEAAAWAFLSVGVFGVIGKFLLDKFSAAAADENKNAARHGGGKAAQGKNQE